MAELITPQSAANLLVRIPIRWTLQRTLGIFNVLFYVSLVLGPQVAPVLFSAYVVFLHIIFVSQNIRNSYGSYQAYTRSVQHSETDWVKRYCDTCNVKSIHDLAHDLPFASINHMIIVPNFKESLETLVDTLDVLASHDMALTNYKVCLAMEAGEEDGESKAKYLKSRYTDHFLDICYTLHPMGQDTRGKSSNVNHCVRDLVNHSRHSENDILTIIDADTCFAQDYFLSLSFHYAVAAPEQRRLLYFAPSTVFDRYTTLILEMQLISPRLSELRILDGLVLLYPTCILSHLFKFRVRHIHYRFH